jgi:wobble nucleotide-excising tRNase
MFGLRKRVKTIENALDDFAPFEAEGGRWNLRRSVDRLHEKRIERLLQLAAQEQGRVNARLMALEQSRETVTTSAEPKVTFFVADTLAELIQRICLLEKQIPAFLTACIADHDKRIGEVEKEVSERNTHLWKVGIETHTRAISKTKAIEARIEGIENGTAPGLQSRVAEISDNLRYLEESTAATLHQYADAVLTFRDDLTLLMEHLRLKFTMTPEVPAVPAQPSKRIVVAVETKKKG